MPKRAHELFGRFVDRRIDNEKERLREFKTDSGSVRAFAEAAAFQIVADSSLGLNPKRQALLDALAQTRTEWQEPNLLLDLLEGFGFARGESQLGDGPVRRFTFSLEARQTVPSLSSATRRTALACAGAPDYSREVAQHPATVTMVRQVQVSHIGTSRSLLVGGGFISSDRDSVQKMLALQP